MTDEPKQIEPGEPWETTTPGYHDHAYGIPEDWEAVIDKDGNEIVIAHPERGARIVACVNACAGIADPADAIAKARDALEAACDFLEEWTRNTGDRHPDLRNALRAAVKRIDPEGWEHLSKRP